MLRIFCLLLLIILAAAGAAPAHAQTAVPPSPTPTATPLPAARLDAPLSGGALQGKVAILGRAAGAGFNAYELEFGYANDTSATWFIIHTASAPVDHGPLAEWDTSTISDGDYTLRLVVYRQDAAPAVVQVTGLRVRNYTPIETSTPTPLTPTATLLPGEFTQTPTPTATPLAPTATVLPTNPAILTGADLTGSMRDASLGTLALFALGGIYFIARRIRYRR